MAKNKPSSFNINKALAGKTPPSTNAALKGKVKGNFKLIKSSKKK